MTTPEARALQEEVIQLYDWQHGGTSFYCALYTLFQKADAINTIRLALAFPNHYKVLQMWNEAVDLGDDLFRQYGLTKEK